MSYQVVFTNRAEKQLAATHPAMQRRIRAAVRALADDPRPAGTKRLQSNQELWRIRVGEYRVVYTINGHMLVVTVVRVAPRGGAYKK